MQLSNERLTTARGIWSGALERDKRIRKASAGFHLSLQRTFCLDGSSGEHAADDMEPKPLAHAKAARNKTGYINHPV
jgi:hypothetical protein